MTITLDQPNDLKYISALRVADVRSIIVNFYTKEQHKYTSIIVTTVTNSSHDNAREVRVFINDVEDTKSLTSLVPETTHITDLVQYDYDERRFVVSPLLFAYQVADTP